MANRRELAELLYLSATAKPEEGAARERMLKDALYPLGLYEVPPAEKERLAALLHNAPTEEARFHVCRVAIDRVLDGTPKKFQGVETSTVNRNTTRPSGAPLYLGPQRIESGGFALLVLGVTLGLIFLVDLMTMCQRGG